MPEIDIVSSKKNSEKRRPPKKRKKMGPIETFLSGVLPWKGDSVGEAVRKIVLLVSIIVLFVAGFIMLDFYVLRDQRNNEEVANYAEQRERSASDDVVTILMPDDDDDESSANSGEDKNKDVEVLAEYLPFYEQNNDFVGWIELYPYIQMPVVQTDDNEYYLKHTFDKGPNENGTIFADCRGKIGPGVMPGNTLLYGHNLITNNYFQPLSHYRKEGMEFLKQNYLIEFDTLYERNKYFVFSVFLTNTNEQHGEVFDYWNTVYFRTKSEFDNYIAEVLDRSYFYTGVDLEYGDEILTLSTCDFSMFSDMRLVVMARKVRDDESLELDTSKFIDNSGFDENNNVRRKMFDAYYKNYACEWGGRKWDPAYIKDFKGTSE
ncbi:MAG: class B sortase [Ruminiclostridium sp.]|nr:class B sortase [Ruminiclostridium sp.]